MIVFVLIICIWLLSIWLQPVLQPYMENVLLGMYGEQFQAYIPYQLTALHLAVNATVLGFIIGLPWQIRFNLKMSRALRKLTFISDWEDENIRFILSVARKQHGYVTAADIAAQSEMTIQKAQSILNQLQKDGFADLSVAATGDILYYFAGFQTGEE